MIESRMRTSLCQFGPSCDFLDVWRKMCWSFARVCPASTPILPSPRSMSSSLASNYREVLVVALLRVLLGCCRLVRGCCACLLLRLARWWPRSRVWRFSLFPPATWLFSDLRFIFILIHSDSFILFFQFHSFWIINPLFPFYLSWFYSISPPPLPSWNKLFMPINSPPIIYACRVIFASFILDWLKTARKSPSTVDMLWRNQFWTHDTPPSSSTSTRCSAAGFSTTWPKTLSSNISGELWVSSSAPFPCSFALKSRAILGRALATSFLIGGCCWTLRMLVVESCTRIVKSPNCLDTLLVWFSYWMFSRTLWMESCRRRSFTTPILTCLLRGARSWRVRWLILKRWDILLQSPLCFNYCCMVRGVLFLSFVASLCSISIIPPWPFDSYGVVFSLTLPSTFRRGNSRIVCTTLFHSFPQSQFLSHQKPLISPLIQLLRCPLCHQTAMCFWSRWWCGSNRTWICWLLDPMDVAKVHSFAFLEDCGPSTAALCKNQLFATFSTFHSGRTYPSEPSVTSTMHQWIFLTLFYCRVLYPDTEVDMKQRGVVDNDLLEILRVVQLGFLIFGGRINEYGRCVFALTHISHHPIRFHCRTGRWMGIGTRLEGCFVGRG